MNPAAQKIITFLATRPTGIEGHGRLGTQLRGAVWFPSPIPYVPVNYYISVLQDNCMFAKPIPF
jgi:hypothetical protein